jgi:hypothetical protein
VVTDWVTERVTDEVTGQNPYFAVLLAVVTEESHFIMNIRFLFHLKLLNFIDNFFARSRS